MPRTIYLDAHATTPCDPRVVEAMLPVFTTTFGNASSREHAPGWQAEALVEQARAHVAALIGAREDEIVFTSGGTESDNLAIKGGARAAAGRSRHLVTSAIEHKAVLESCRRLEREGFALTVVPVDGHGRIDPEMVRAALRPGTVRVSVMAANNETGTLQPVAELGAICRERGVRLHCDAVQAAAWLPLDVEALGVDLLTLSAHKFYGPKGVGALYVRRRGRRATLEPLADGGGHERGLRSGTLNVPGIVGMGRAAELALAERDADRARIGALRDRLLARLIEGLGEAVAVNGSLTERLPNNLSFCLRGLEGESIIGQLRGLALSSGAACMSAAAEPSHVLAAMRVPGDLAATALRVGLHRFTTPEEIDTAAATIVTIARRRLHERAAR